MSDKPITNGDAVVGCLTVCALFLMAIWIGVTFAEWTSPSKPTLVHVIVGQWYWLVDLAHRIY